MNSLSDATLRQLEAADPSKSTWLSANAGSGKTRVLTDRVARLLLNGVKPQHILCLTYTKAAASEMQNRLFKRLGAWAMMDDSLLTSALRELGVSADLSTENLRNARTLFARAIETPGGLKIQTIHSFCGALLRRFPLEAGVSPQFSEIEDRAAALLRTEIVDAMAKGHDAKLVRDISRHYTGEDFVGLTQLIVTKRHLFDTEFDRSTVLKDLGHRVDLDPDVIMKTKFSPGDWSLIQRLIPLLAESGDTDQQTAEALSKVTDLGFPSLPQIEASFLTKAFSPKKYFFAKPLREMYPDLAKQAYDLVERTMAARQMRLALQCVQQAGDLHAFARSFLKRYEEEKKARAWLDFDDLIEKARALLSDSQVAAWVLFRIDGGIDHILVDEAQDTSPSQWDVVRKLAEEFSSGQGARTDIERTLFVVGDQKQSIYSFQGADPEAFGAMRDEFDQRLRDSGQALQQTSLDYSFRSSRAILSLVDTVFAGTDGFPEESKHLAFHGRLPGRVDVWPIVESAKAEDESAWFEPIDLKGQDHHHRALATGLASKIRHMIDEKVLIPTGFDDHGEVTARPVRPADFLILVRRRSGVFHEIIRACKEEKLPIAGADRLRVGAEIAVKDLQALLSFLAMPDDDLSLACALRSPLFGWSEDALFRLAHGRGHRTLWQVLRDDERHQTTIDVLVDLLEKIDFLRPYDLIERILTRHQGRKKILGRLGFEAEDGIDALLAQAMAFERNSVPSLTGFLVWMETDDLEIKRQIDTASDQIRIMTVHGAKGLEAPIVVLPECEKRKASNPDQILQLGNYGVWCPRKNHRPDVLEDVIAQSRLRQDEESLRLLYVALTRAEKWLIVAGSGEIDKKHGTDWHSRISAAAVAGKDLDTPFGNGKRIEFGDWDSFKITAAPELPGSSVELEPCLTLPAKRPSDQGKKFAPSSVEGLKALPGEGLAEADALAYGNLVHALLEHLPSKAVHLWKTAFEEDFDHFVLSEELSTQAFLEAENVLNLKGLSHIFSDDSLAEIEIIARAGPRQLVGVIDRLIVRDDHVMAVDFKTNSVVPSTAEDVPVGLVKQMAAYADALGQIYPEHRIDMAILWTAEPRLMSLPHDIVRRWVKDTRYLDDLRIKP